MVRSVSLTAAKEVLDAAQARAAELDVPMNLAVTNAEGNLVALRRMDGGKLVSTTVAKNKAYTAAAVKKPTHELKEASEPGGDVYGLESTEGGRIVVFGGGYPLRRDGNVVGAIGVSGGAVEEDMDVASAGVDRFDELDEY